MGLIIISKGLSRPRFEIADQTSSRLPADISALDHTFQLSQISKRVFRNHCVPPATALPRRLIADGFVPKSGCNSGSALHSPHRLASEPTLGRRLRGGLPPWMLRQGHCILRRPMRWPISRIWMCVVRSPARPRSSIEICHDKYSSIVRE